MKIKELNSNNISEFEDCLDPDMAENMSRMYFRGIACTGDTDDSLKAGLMGDFFEENPEIAACAEMYGEFNATVAVMYGQTKYGMLFDTGTRRISTATNKMSSFDKADFAEDMIRVYEAKNKKYHNLLKERK